MKKLKRAAAILLAALLLSMSGISFSTKVNADPDLGNAFEEVVFLDTAEVEDSINVLKENEKVSPKLQQDYVKKNLIKIHRVNKDNLLNTAVEKNGSHVSYAFDVDKIKGDSQLRQKVRELSERGTMVYVYGDGITLKEYDEIAGLEGLRFFDPAQTDALKQKGSASPGPGLVDNKRYNIIGYTAGNPDSLYLCEIQTFNEKEKINTPGVERFKLVSGVLHDAALRVKGKADQGAGKSVKVMGLTIPFVRKDTVKADSTAVQYSPHNTNMFYFTQGYMTTLMGQVDTLWTLFKENNETSDTYDNFTVKISYSLSGEDFGATTADIKHTLPYTSDAIYEWGPKDSTSSSFTVSVPWRLTYSFSTESSMVVNECGSQPSDYARWILKPRAWQSWLSHDYSDQCLFVPATAWLSTGRYAAITTNITVTFTNRTYASYDPKASQVFTIGYAY